MRIRTWFSVLAFALGGALAGVAGAEPIDVTTERFVSADQLGRDVEVRDVRRTSDGAVSGTIVNRSGKALRDVRLVIRHLWLWNDEFHPKATGDPSRAEYSTVQQTIPPGGQLEFTYRPAEPLMDRPDGHFETQVRVASVVEVSGGVGTAPIPPDSPTAGAGERRPPAPIPAD